MVQVGEKTVDCNPNFRLFLVTRNPEPQVSCAKFSFFNIFNQMPSHGAFAARIANLNQVAVGGQSLVCMINFTTTRAGLTGQLLGRALHLERPELEQRKSDLLKQEEELKIQISNLEDTLLDQLNASTGNILENKELLDSLNQTKSKSATIENSLKESTVLQDNLEKEGNIYLPLAEFASKLFFVIKDLSKINQMYQFSQVSFTPSIKLHHLHFRRLIWLSTSEPFPPRVREELTRG